MIVPALNLKQLKKYSGALAGLSDLSDSTVLDRAGDLVEMIHAALTRNYPEITRDQVEEMIDLRNLLPLTQAIIGVSGLGETEMGSR